MQVKIQQLERDMEQQTGYKSGKEYIKSSSIAQVPKSAARQKNEKHSRKLQWVWGDQYHHEVKVPKLISCLLYYIYIYF